MFYTLTLLHSVVLLYSVVLYNDLCFVLYNASPLVATWYHPNPTAMQHPMKGISPMSKILNSINMQKAWIAKTCNSEFSPRPKVSQGNDFCIKNASNKAAEAWGGESCKGSWGVGSAHFWAQECDSVCWVSNSGGGGTYIARQRTSPPNRTLCTLQLQLQIQIHSGLVDGHSAQCAWLLQKAE